MVCGVGGRVWQKEEHKRWSRSDKQRSCHEETWVNRNYKATASDSSKNGGSHKVQNLYDMYKRVINKSELEPWPTASIFCLLKNKYCSIVLLWQRLVNKKGLLVILPESLLRCQRILSTLFSEVSAKYHPHITDCSFLGKILCYILKIYRGTACSTSAHVSIRPISSYFFLINKNTSHNLKYTVKKFGTIAHRPVITHAHYNL